MKTILILDEMPECCKECRAMDAGNTNLCKAKTFRTPKGNEFFYCVDDISKKPEWCPLKPLPQKRELNYTTRPVQIFNNDLSLLKYAVDKGYNKAIDDILGEEKE